MKAVNRYTWVDPADGTPMVWCMRPGIFGNPFKKGRDGDRDEVCDKYERWFYSKAGRQVRERVEEVIKGGEVLLCCCKPKRCHCDTIAAYVNNGYKNPTPQEDKQGRLFAKVRR